MYYLQEIKGGPGTNGTIFVAAGTASNGNNATSVGWGSIFIFDSPLHAGTTPNTTHLGKSTGTAIVSNKGGIPDGGVQVNSNHIFGNGSRYYKSSLKVEGMVDFTSTPPYECLVPGGTGYFRGYKGYGLAVPETSAFAPLVVYKWSIFLTR